MSKVQLLEQIKELSRAELAEEILQGLDEPSQLEYERVWAADIKSRHDDLKSGKVKPITREEVIRDVESRLK